jgi:predicted RNase H-like nuclease
MNQPMHVGVDGCRAGWLAVTRGHDAGPQVAVYPDFAALLAATGDAVIAVDMPIGLPDFTSGGRGPEQAIRPLLGLRKSSVFSIPARSAVYCLDYREGCAAAYATSAPPRMISKQAFYLFGKIREIDAVLNPQMQLRVRETHPELAFWRLNGERPLHTAKKAGGRINPAGSAERCEILQRHGFDAGFLSRKPPRGAGIDDFLDACVCAVIAGRIASGLAEPFPKAPIRDSRGLQIAIWA